MDTVDTVDFRWSTRNTKLASALLVLGFELMPQPFSTVVSAENAGKGYLTTIWFKPYKESKRKQTQNPDTYLLCQGVQRLWLEGVDKKHPEVFWMRSALEARDWILKDYIRRKFSAFQVSNLCETTDSIRLASALVGIGIKPLGFLDRVFYFEPSVFPFMQEFLTEEGNTRMHWSRHVLEQHEILLREINGPRNERQIEVLNNDKRLLMSVHASPELKRQLLKELHK